jgi:hypothetical protein
LLLRELTASASRLALVGLAKNTGKTVALAALLAELHDVGRLIGVTSVGRDGEERDVIDLRIEKPRVMLPEGSLVATTDGLLSASGIPHSLLENTGLRTPLGPVVIARLREPGTIEVAGPSTAAEVRAVSDAMLGHGAEQVLIDGAIDRRAASSPDVSDALVMATGAILSEELDEVVARTRRAVELVRLPRLPEDSAASRQLRQISQSLAHGACVALDERLQARPLPPRFVLSVEPEALGQALSGAPLPRWLLVSGALPEAFVSGLAPLVRRAGGELTLVVSDPTKVFLSQHGPGFYARQGVGLQTLRSIDLRALVVNPIAPQSHSFDSSLMRTLLGEAIAGVAICDVMDPSYGADTVDRLPAAEAASRGSGT